MKWPWVSRRRLEELQAELDWTTQVIEDRRRDARRRGDDHLRQVQELTAEQRRLDTECAAQSERLGRAVKLLEEVRITQTLTLSKPPQVRALLHVGWESGRRSLLADLDRAEEARSA